MIGHVLGDEMVPRIDEMLQVSGTGVERRDFADRFGRFPGQDRLPAIGDHADHMLGCVDALRRAAGELPIEHLPDYYRHLGQLQQATLALRLSAMEGSEPAVQHWFDHVKQECNGCHTRFRVSTDGDEPATPTPPPSK